MIVKCDNCGKEFERETRRANEAIKRGYKQYCSDECKANSKKIKCNCANCGKELLKNPSEIKKSKSGNVFCSKSCAASYNNSHYRTGENNPNWKGGKFSGKKHLKVAYRTYISECANCGITEECVLEVHHIDENRENNDADNLIILCANCHCRVHRGNLIITDEIKNKRRLKNNIKSHESN